MPKRHLLTQTQMESLTSPVRLAIIQRLEIDRHATARELANRMGRPVTALYHHLKQLLSVGLIHVIDEQKGTRRPEAVYAMLARHVSSANAVKTPRGRATYGKAGGRVADAGARAFSAAVTSGEARFDGAQRNAMVRFYVLRADHKKLARLNQLLRALESEATQPSETGEEIQLTVLLSAMGK